MALEILPSQKKQFIQKIIDNNLVVPDFTFPEERVKLNYQGSYTEFDKAPEYYHIEIYANEKTNYYRFKKDNNYPGKFTVFYSPASGKITHSIGQKDWNLVIALFDNWLKVLKGEMDSFSFNKGVSEKKSDIPSIQQIESTEIKVEDVVEELLEVPVVRNFDQIYEEAIEHGLVRIDSIFDKESIRYNYNVQFVEWLKEKWNKSDVGEEMTFENFKVYLEKGWRYKEGWEKKLKRWVSKFAKPVKSLIGWKANDNVWVNILIGALQIVVAAILFILFFHFTGKKLPFW